MTMSPPNIRTRNFAAQIAITDASGSLICIYLFGRTINIRCSVTSVGAEHISECMQIVQGRELARMKTVVAIACRPQC